MRRVFRTPSTLADAVLFHPMHEIRHLNHLAWCAATVRMCEQHGFVFDTEYQQFIALLESKKAQFARPLGSTMVEELRDASKALWRARRMLVS